MRTEPRTPAAIAARMRKPPQQISSLLKRMIQSGYLTVSENPKDRRSRLYRIKEGFFDLWLAMSESRAERKRLGYLVKVFELWYQGRPDRERKRAELRQALAGEQPALEVRENQFSYLDYLSEVGDCDERCQAKLELSVDLLKAGQALKAKDLLKELKPLAPQQGIFTWITDKAWQWAEGATDLDISQWFEGLIDYWKVQRSGDLEKAVEAAHRLGLDLSEQGLHEIRIELLRDALNCVSSGQDRISLLLQIAKSQKMMGQLDSALDSLMDALNLCLETGDKAKEGTTLNNISQVYKARGNYDKALEHLKQSLAICQQIGDRAGLCATLFNIGHIHLQKEEMTQAMLSWMKVYRMAKEMNLAQALDALNTLAEALNLPGGMEGWEKIAKEIETTSSAPKPPPS